MKRTPVPRSLPNIGGACGPVPAQSRDALRGGPACQWIDVPSSSGVNGSQGKSSSSGLLQSGHGMPAPPQVQARGPCHGRSGWSSQVQPLSAQREHFIGNITGFSRVFRHTCEPSYLPRRKDWEERSRPAARSGQSAGLDLCFFGDHARTNNTYRSYAVADSSRIEEPAGAAGIGVDRIVRTRRDK
jgi:hypothetical protein